MTKHTIDISCTGPTPEDITAANGDKVTFDNTTGASVTITFASPGIFNPSPGGSITIDKDGTEQLTIGTIANGTDFSYPDCGASLDTRSGRINP